MRRLVLAVLAVLLAACAHGPASRAGRPPLILISIDGFRADYMTRGVTPTLAKLAAEGATSPKGMRPSFPANTFPNHYALVTGLRPDRNGIVQNAMEDPARPGVVFSMGDRERVKEGWWWNDATPLWVTAERAGIRTAPLDWPGSEAAIQNLRPSHSLPFVGMRPPAQRVDLLLELLDGPRRDWPGFLTLYFDQVDTAGHAGDPGERQVDAALAEVDAAISRLLAGLAARKIVANLVIVADHGMAPVPAQQVVYLDEEIPNLPVRMVYGGGSSAFEPLPGREREAEAAFLKPDPRYACWRKGEVPERLHYGRHRRAPAIVCLAKTGWFLYLHSRERTPWVGVKGQHGFDPEDPLMAALFIANGPAFKRGGAVAPFDNVDVYPLLAHLLGVTPEPGDGQLSHVAGVLK